MEARIKEAWILKDYYIIGGFQIKNKDIPLPPPEWTNLNSFQSTRQKEVPQEKPLVLETSESRINLTDSIGQNSDQFGYCLLPFLESVFFSLSSVINSLFRLCYTLCTESQFF